MSAIDASIPQDRGPRRERRPGASVTLRRGSGQGPSDADMMDPAAKSLADALRITYRLLQAAMLVILAIYLLSGFQSIKESERGLRLLFGRIQNQAPLPSGFQFAMPEPIGELVHISTGEVPIDFNKEFFPNITRDEEEKLQKDGVPALAGGSNVLDPDADGMLLTADGNIVHARVKVTYRREQPGDFARNIAEDPDAGGKPEEQIERRIVVAAVRRGMLAAAANATLDEFLKNQPDPGRKNFRPVDEVAQGIAQRALDDIHSGIAIRQFNVTHRMPPRHTISEFNSVQAAQSKSSQSIQEADGARREILNRTAGEAAEMLLTLIDQYEREFESGQADQAAATLDTIHGMMLGRAVSVPGQELVPKVFGQVSQAITDAEQYRTQVVTKARSDAALFTAKQAAYKANPSYFIAKEWGDAMQALLTREGVQTMWVPDTLERLVVLINRDPDISREQETARKAAEAKAAQDERVRNRTREQNERRFDAVGE